MSRAPISEHTIRGMNIARAYGWSQEYIGLEFGYSTAAVARYTPKGLKATTARPYHDSRAKPTVNTTHLDRAASTPNPRMGRWLQ